MAAPAAYSLQNRLLVAISLLLTVFLGLTGVVLDRAFRSSVEAGVAEQLQVQIYVLLAAIDEADGEFYFSENLREPRFSQLNAGLYGFISTADDGVLLRTPSALDLDFNALSVSHDLQRGDSRFQRADTALGSFFISNYSVTWENRPLPLILSVVESTQTYLAEVSKFRASLWSWLGGLAVLLLVLQLLLLHWGLAPLRRLAGDLQRIEGGHSEALEENYPRELSPVTDNLNLLIQSERKQQQRYRTTLGDLAHSLKTPLAVVHGEMPALAEPSLSASERVERILQVQEQLDRMTQIVTYQLQRAVRSDQPGTLAQQISVQHVAAGICRALEKVYRDKDVRIQQDVDPRLNFMGDERDLAEILGNLLDNACKYGGGKVRITARLQGGQRPLMRVDIEDNGPGIPPEAHDRVMQRGIRLDTLASGQGIGMAVVVDIVSSYGGEISITDSELGGACLRLQFPNVRYT